MLVPGTHFGHREYLVAHQSPAPAVAVPTAAGGIAVSHWGGCGDIGGPDGLAGTGSRGDAAHGVVR